jgi:UDP-glucose 4-epimerase
MIYIDTLCEFLLYLMENECCGYYHPQDKDYVDTSELVINMRRQIGKKTWLIGNMNIIISLGI